MKTGKSIIELATEIQRQFQAKKDFLLPSKKIEVITENGIEFAFLHDKGDFQAPLTDNSHRQVGEICKIPAKYYDLMRSTSSNLLGQNLSYWLNRSSDRRMIRALDGNIRAVLSDTYRRLDNYDLAQAVLPMLQESGCVIVSCEITEDRLYIKAINYQVQAEVKTKLNVGEVVAAGVIVGNSEIGKGSLFVKPFVEVLSCKNGNVCDKYRLRKYHSGARNEELNEAFEFSNETKTLEDKTLWSKVRDLVKHSLEESL